jgi:tetratricopeptide (TPR) repeat protein
LIYSGGHIPADDEENADAEISGIYYKSGLLSLKKNNYAEAIEKFTKAISYRLDFPEALSKLAECHEKTRAFNKAIYYYRLCAKYLQMQPGMTKEQSAILAAVNRAKDRLDINGKELNKIKQGYTSKIFGFISECTSRKYYRLATRSIDSLLKIDPDNKSAKEFLERLEPARKYLEKGEACYNKGEYDKAIAEYTSALKQNPKYIKAYIGRSDTYQKKGEADNAIADCNKAIKLAPNNSDAYLTRAEAYFRLKKDHTQAFWDFDKSISLDPKYARAYNNRAVAYSDVGDHERALQDINKAISLDPKNCATYCSRAGIYSSLKDFDKALEDLSAAIRLNPKFSIIYVNRGAIYGDRGEVDRAIADYCQAIRLNPNCIEAYFNRAINYSEKGNYKAAVADAEKALSVSTPDHPWLPTIKECLSKWRAAIK